MKGMKTKGADFNTDFGDAKPQDGPELPLARIQEGMFEQSSTVTKNSYFGNELIDEAALEEVARLIKEGYTSGQLSPGDDSGREGSWDLKIDFDGDVSESTLEYIAENTKTGVQSGEIYEEYEGKEQSGWWTLTMDMWKQASKKKAAIFDGFAHRVTIESKAGDTNETYSTVLNMLSAADIRYREVRRYTVDPDRVMLDILVNKEDVDVIKELNKESKKDNITFTFNDNISEGVQPKVITTPEKDVEEKVTASKKKIAVKVGDEIRITSDNESYNEFRDKTWTVEKVSYNTEDHPGYDTGMEGEALIDAEELPYSLYEYEFEIVKEASKEESN